MPLAYRERKGEEMFRIIRGDQTGVLAAARRGAWGLITVVVLGVPVGAWADGAAQSEGSEFVQEECGGWLPDLRCGRSGRWEGFHKPIVAPYLFEDPFITTGIYPYYVHHEFGGRSALQGGRAHVAAVQIRVALTDRLAFVATKDGRAWLRPGNPLLDDQQGWLNIGGGLKALLYEDIEQQFLVAGTLRFEFDSGSSDVFQDHGDGLVIPSVSFAWGEGPFHVIGDLGGQIPLDGGDQSSSIFTHIYADIEVAPFFTPFVQISGIHWVDGGNGQLPVDLNIGVTLPIDTVQDVLGTGRFEGADVWNLGSRRVSGLQLWTAALGFHVPLAEHVTFSAAYERPISHHHGVFKQRLTTALAIEF